jgi:hypothetical protein
MNGNNIVVFEPNDASTPYYSKLGGIVLSQYMKASVYSYFIDKMSKSAEFYFESDDLNQAVEKFVNSLGQRSEHDGFVIPVIQTAILDGVEYISPGEVTMRIAVEVSEILFYIPNAVDSQLYSLYDTSYKADVLESSSSNEFEHTGL